ncbi:M20/M25/M40 family metallo-hydrolase [Umezawaea sp. NPDC059074]|uniref:M20/M25/M40 family metallo-hydrolase n=1 Tax=Umezawaea sp. NPDC059074 TaxID=3346716 RepID=UPI0036A1F4A0
MTKDLAAYLTGRRDRLVEELLEFVRIPAVAEDGGPAMRTMADRCAAKCAEAGLDVRVEDTEGHPVVFASGGPRDAPFTLLTYGHYDVFPVSGQQGWDTDPFDPVVRGDRVHGRGAGDNKGQFLSHLNAFQWWQREAGGLPIRVKVVLDGEEERGSPTLPEFVLRNRDELAADLCVYSDGPMLPGDRPAVLFGARGGLALELTATRPGGPLHSGNFGGVVANPVLALARLLADLVAPNGDLLAPGVDDGIDVLTDTERRALAAMEFDPVEFRARTGTASLPAEFGESHYERLLCRPCFTVSGITGGYTGEGVRGVIPSTATAKADVRLVSAQDPDAVFESIRAFARGYGVDVVELFAQPPSRTPLDHPYADLVARALADTTGREPVRVPSLAGTTPDWVFTRLLGLPAFMVPLAPADQNHHGPNETMKISLYLQGIRTSARLVEVLAQNGRVA